MKKNRTIVILALVAVLVAVALIVSIALMAGNQIDVVASQAIESFEVMTKAAPQLVTQDAAGDWNIAAPDGSARFILGADGTSVSLAWDAQPFLAAGLDVAKLPDTYLLMDGELVYTVSVTTSGAARQSSTTLAAINALSKSMPDNFGYHASMDHFGVMVGEAGMFEWAKSLDVHTVTGAIQDKDMVFVLSPEPLLQAGVQPEQVEGWRFAQVEVMDMGTTRYVDKFLKPFDIL